MQKTKTVIISHNDLDGIGASTILEQYQKRYVLFDQPDHELDVRNVHVNDVDEIILELQKEIMEGTHIESIYIADLTPRIDETWELLSEWDKAENRPFVIILDHHASEQYRTEKYDFAVIKPGEDGALMSATTLAQIYCQHVQMITMAQAPGELDEDLAADFFEFIKYCLAFDNLIRAYDTWDWTRNPSYLKEDQLVFADHLNTLFWGIGLEAFRYHLVEGFDRIVFKDEAGPSYDLTTEFIDYTRRYYGREIDLLVRQEEQYINGKVKAAVPMTVEYEGRSLTVGVVIASQHQSKLGNRIAETYDVAVISTGTDRLSFRTKDDSIDVSVIAKKLFKGGGHKPAAGGRLEVNLTNTLVKHLNNQFGGVTNA